MTSIAGPCEPNILANNTKLFIEDLKESMSLNSIPMEKIFTSEYIVKFDDDGRIIGIRCGGDCEDRFYNNWKKQPPSRLSYQEQYKYWESLKGYNYPVDIKMLAPKIHSLYIFSLINNECKGNPPETVKTIAEHFFNHIKAHYSKNEKIFDTLK